MSDELTVLISGLEAGAPLDSDRVRRAVELTAATVDGIPGEISVSFVDPETIGDLNATYLGRAAPTDVLAFDLSDERGAVGDIYVCPELARVSADERGLELEEELVRLVVHGVLHLLGYDHPEGPGREQSDMFRLQEAIVEQLL